RRFPCDFPSCQSGISFKTTLQRHTCTHESKRPFPCDFPGCGCGYLAKEASALAKHKRTHSSERPFPCDASGCQYRAVSSSNLSVHMRTQHK
ncbi:hypothetical protein T492DRAFT_573279, partial [Pavlovales sp. CCMP2436]